MYLAKVCLIAFAAGITSTRRSPGTYLQRTKQTTFCVFTEFWPIKNPYFFNLKNLTEFDWLLGLYLMEDTKANEWIARYSGDPLTKVECDQRCHSQYIMQVHKNLFLDAADPIHFEGRFINDARNSKHKVNARFAAGYTTSTCSITDHVWVRIYTTRKIKAGGEIFIDYGEDFWSQQPQIRPATTPTHSKTAATSSLWAAPAPTSLSLWTAPAPTPELTLSSDHTTKITSNNRSSSNSSTDNHVGTASSNTITPRTSRS